MCDGVTGKVPPDSRSHLGRSPYTCKHCVECGVKELSRLTFTSVRDTQCGN